MYHAAKIVEQSNYRVDAELATRKTQRGTKMIELRVRVGKGETLSLFACFFYYFTREIILLQGSDYNSLHNQLFLSSRRIKNLLMHPSSLEPPEIPHPHLLLSPRHHLGQFFLTPESNAAFCIANFWHISLCSDHAASWHSLEQ